MVSNNNNNKWIKKRNYMNRVHNSADMMSLNFTIKMEKALAQARVVYCVAMDLIRAFETKLKEKSNVII